MLRLSVKSVRGHLGRFLLTVVAVTLGVAFVAGSFVLRDSIDNTLDDLVTSGSKGVDVFVRGTKVEDRENAQRRPVRIDLAQRLATVDGVARSSPELQGLIMIAGKDGVVVRNSGAPTLGFAFRAGDPAFKLVEGQGPTGPDEIALERSTLTKARLAVGDTTTAIVGEGPRQVRITGVVEFGTSLFGATATLVDEATARATFAPDGNVRSISLTAAAGVSQETLRARVAAVLPSGTQAATGQALIDESRHSIQKGLSIFTTIMLVFAFVALFVGAFIIVNTFSILLAQRTRELALLRAVGASRRQVRRMVLGEAVIIGLVGSVVGIGVGTGLAALLKAVIRSVWGVGIVGGLPVAPRTIWASVAVGVVVTLLSATLPAWRASRIPPVAAMRDDMVAPPSSIRRRGALGLVMFAVGTALLTWGVTRSDVNWQSTGIGAALVLLGALVAAPLAARPVVRAIVWPFLRFGGVVGRLAGQNSLRVPRRTANTASALMIGLALVSGLALVASSIKASVADLVSQQLTSDFVLTAGGQAPLPAGVELKAAGLSGVQSTAAFASVPLAVGDLRSNANVTTGRGLVDNVRMGVVSGSLTSIDNGEVLVNETTATEHGWRVGSILDATVGRSAGERLTVGGIFKDSQLLESPFIVGQSLYHRSVPASDRQDFLLLIKTRPGADPAAMKQALIDMVKPYLVVSVETGEEYIDSTADQVNQMLSILYTLLLLSILIAVFGIVNTLALSVVERTREIGLLRAVGLRRRQLSLMITIEAVATAVFGAVLGTLVGLGLGAALQHAMRDEGLDVLAVPWVTIAAVLIASGLVGVIAAVLPAIRAVRLNVLEAIATE